MTAETLGRTGVEMEALTGAAVGLLTIYDMCKAADRGMRIEGVRLLEKTRRALGPLRARPDADRRRPAREAPVRWLDHLTDCDRWTGRVRGVRPRDPGPRRPRTPARPALAVPAGAPSTEESPCRCTTVEPLRLYRQIAGQIAALIDNGEFPAGSRLPAERELATLLGVSRTSVREAIISLEIAGRVEVRVGTGIFVAEPGAAQIAGDWSTRARARSNCSPRAA